MLKPNWHIAANLAVKYAKNALKINVKVKIINVKKPDNIKNSFSFLIPITCEYKNILFNIWLSWIISGFVKIAINGNIDTKPVISKSELKIPKIIIK